MDFEFPEDRGRENGEYFCECFVCKKTFIGHKRRSFCKACSQKENDKQLERDLQSEPNLFSIGTECD